MNKFLQSIFFILVFTAANAQGYSYSWANVMGFAGSPGQEETGYDIVVDNAGSMYITGQYYGIFDFDPGPGVANTDAPNNANSNIFICKYDNAGNFVWLKTLNNANTNLKRGVSLRVDSKNNLLVTGYFNGVVDFNPSPAVGDTFIQRATNASISVKRGFILKLNSNGDFIWAKQLTSANETEFFELELDANDNLFLSGSIKGRTDFDMRTGIADTSWVEQDSYISDGFITKLDSNANLIWVKTFSGPGTSTTQNFMNPVKICLDADGNIYSIGNFKYTIDFNPNAGVNNLVGVGNSTFSFILKLDSLGNFLWAKQYGNGSGSVTSNNFGRDIEALPNGDIVAVGNFRGTVNYDNGGTNASLSAPSTSTATSILKLSAAGNFIWVKGFVGVQFSTSGTSADPAVVKFDDNKNIYIAGKYNTSVSYGIDFDPDTSSFVMLSPAQNNQIFLAKLDSNGKFINAESIGSTSVNYVTAMVLDNSDNIYMTGSVAYNAYLDPNSTTNGVFAGNFGSYDIFVLKYGQSLGPLAIDAFKLSGKVNGNRDELTWQFDNSIDITNYELQELQNGNYKTIATINNEINKQIFTFNNAQYKTSIYRVVAIANNGNKTFSNTISLARKELNSIVMYPNPASNEMHLDIFSVNNSNATIKIYDITGKLVHQVETNLDNGANHTTIDIAELATGVYTVKVSDDKGWNEVMQLQKM